MICSTERKGRCSCGRKEFYCCSSLSCQCFVCKQCCEEAPSDSITFVNPTEGSTTESDSESDNESLTSDVSEDHSFDDGNAVLAGVHDSDVLDDTDVMLTADDLDDFVTSSVDPDLPNDYTDEDDADNGGFVFEPILPSTNDGETPYPVRSETTTRGMSISGYVVLNQCGTCLARWQYDINGSSKHKFFLQKITATSIGKSIPLLYPEAMLFPSIFWRAADTSGAMLGAITSPLLTKNVCKFDFASVYSHICSRLKSLSSTTSTDPRYLSFCYDICTNITSNHSDTQIVLCRSLTLSSDDTASGLQVRSSGDSALLGSIDCKQNVRNLCASQRHHPMDFFITLTCNQKKHFGVAPLCNWFDSHQ